MENFEAINSHETNQNHIFGLIWLWLTFWRGEKSKEEEEKEEEGGGEEEDQGMFVLESSVFWIPRALVWRLVAPLV